MILYLDTSAFVPLLVAEPASALCRRLWDEADDVVTVRLLYVETAAALAQARRLDQLDRPGHLETLGALDRLWPELDVVEVDEALVRRAARLADEQALRAYDAVHCAAAEVLDDDDLVVASGDRQLVAACAALGLSTVDTSLRSR